MAPQPLHIFQKDVRHLWPETLVAILLLVALAWTIPYGWHRDIYSAYVPLLGGLFHLLLPIAWLVIIARLIQDESLVGDRQFWTSRPYHWASLLLAKLLYLVVFIYLPFFLMQLYLLKHAGLYPTTAMGGLFENLLLLTVVLVLPITAIATVTSTFPRVLLSVLGGILYVILVGALYGFFVLQRMPAPHFAGIVETLVLALPAAAILYQYATRRTATSRGILLATPLVVVLVLAVLPATSLIRGSYPVAAGNDAPQLTSIPVPANAPIPPGNVFSLRGNVLVNIPFAVKDSDNDSDYTVAGVSSLLHGAGQNWSSPYFAAGLPPLIPGPSINNASPYVLIPVSLPQSVFESVRSKPVDLHLSLAADHLKAVKPSSWNASNLPFAVPGHGVCFPASDEEGGSGTSCRFPFKTPAVLFATAPVSSGACGAAGSQSIPGHATLAGKTSFLSFDPVVLVPLNFLGSQGGRATYQVCPGTPIAFVQAEQVGRVRFEVDSKQVLLDPLVMRVPPRSAAGNMQMQQGPTPE